MFFAIKEIIVFLNLWFLCAVCLFHYVIVTEFDYRIQHNRFGVILHAVDSLNVKHELRSKKIKQFCIMQTFSTIFLGLPLEYRVLLFA